MAYNTYPQNISGRVYTTPPLSADPLRYSFLSLPNAEPNLSLPAKEGLGFAEKKYFLLSDPVVGTRVWSTSANIALSGDKVGIGTSEPNTKLTVVGSLSVTDIIYGTFQGDVSTLSAAGNDTEVQFNSAGFLKAFPSFTYKHYARGITVGDFQTLGVNASYSGLLGGTQNAVISGCSGVTFGLSNSATNIYTFVGGGRSNLGGGANSVVVGGCGNSAINTFGTVVGGEGNYVPSVNSAIVGGKSNTADSDYSFIGGGIENRTCNTFTAVGGGQFNCAVGVYSFIGSGVSNSVNGACGGILGGTTNCVQHSKSFIVGSNLTTQAACTTFVNNLSAPGTSHAGTVSFDQLLACKFTCSNSASATDAYITLTIGGSSLAINAYRLS